MYKYLLAVSLFVPFSCVQRRLPTPVSINPTGSYQLEGKTEKKGEEIYGSSGELKVKLLDSMRIAISFFITKGAPSYNSGSFVDTLLYERNKAIYRTPDMDTTCQITFAFTRAGATVMQKQANLNFGCGFGHGVFADGFYKKISDKIPAIIDPMEE